MRGKGLKLISLICLAILGLGISTVTVLESSKANAENIEVNNYIEWSADELFSVFGEPKVFPRTLEAWIQYNESDKSGCIVGNYRDGSNDSIEMEIQTNGNPCLYTMAAGKSDRSVIFTSVDVRSNDFVHLVISFDDDNAYCYINGELKETKELKVQVSNPGLAMCVGGDQRDGNTSYFKGKIKSVMLYSDVRTEKEIFSDMFIAEVSDDNLIASYNLEGVVGQKVIENQAKSGTALVSSEYEFTGEVYKDIADFGPYSNDYVLGLQTSSNTYRKIDNSLMPGGTADSVGLEFRMKQNHTLDEFKNLLSATGNTDGKAWYWMNIRAGSSFMFTILNTKTQKLRIQGGSCVSGSFKKQVDFVDFMDYEVGAEYVWRVTRTVVEEKIAKEGSFVKVYIGKIDEQSGEPEEGWDLQPKCQWLDYTERQTSNKFENDVSVQNGYLGNNSPHAHSLTISSNKYVGLETVVDNQKTLNKVPRGSNYELKDVTSENLLHVGWSKGGNTYSDSDYLPVGYVLENVREFSSYQALTLSINVDKTASIRFRQRYVFGQPLPPELSLKWDVEVIDSNSVAYYFGNIKFGYKLTTDNGACFETSVDKISDGYLKPYSFSVIQSNITEEYYSLRFVCQVWVEFNGVRFYSLERDIDQDGRSIEFITQAALSDIKLLPEGIYSNPIKNLNGEMIGYHYLTQEEYELIASVQSKIDG